MAVGVARHEERLLLVVSTAAAAAKEGDRLHACLVAPENAGFGGRLGLCRHGGAGASAAAGMALWFVRVMVGGVGLGHEKPGGEESKNRCLARQQNPNAAFL
jgi:hypothetical protein